VFLKSLTFSSLIFLSGCTVSFTSTTSNTDISEIEYICGMGTVVVDGKAKPLILVNAEDEETSIDLSKRLKKAYYECLAKYEK
jgi:hypothetical protein